MCIYAERKTGRRKRREFVSFNFFRSGDGGLFQVGDGWRSKRTIRVYCCCCCTCFLAGDAMGRCGWAPIYFSHDGSRPGPPPPQFSKPLTRPGPTHDVDTEIHDTRASHGPVHPKRWGGPCTRRARPQGGRCIAPWLKKVTHVRFRVFCFVFIFFFFSFLLRIPWSSCSWPTNSCPHEAHAPSTHTRFLPPTTQSD